MNDVVPLAVFLDRLRWSPERLAREINRSYGAGTISAKAPYAWLKGSYPRGPVPSLVAAILSDRLGTVVDVSQIWPQRFAAKDHRVNVDHILDLPWSEEHLIHTLRSLAERTETGGATPTGVASGAKLVSVAVDWLTTEGERPRSKSDGDEVSPELIDLLADRTDQLRRLDEAQGGPFTVNWVVHDLRWATRLANEGSYGAATGMRLYGAIAELAQLAGWLYADLGQCALGHRYLLAALRAAKLTDDRSLGAYILSCLSYQLTWCGNGRDALRLIEIARKGAGDVMAGTVRSLLATRQARAHARIGHEFACHRALAEAAQSVETADLAGTPLWSRWVSPAVLVADAGRAQLDLGYPARAEERLLTGLRQLDDEQQRNKLLHHMSVAEARLGQGQIDGAAEATRTALALASAIDSARAHSRLKYLRTKFRLHDAVAAHEAASGIDQILTLARPCG